MSRSALLALVLAVVLGPALGCGSRAVDATPTGAVRAFLGAMQRTEDPRARQEAYRLLCPDAQIALAERARDAAALGGRSFEPWEMLVEDRAFVRGQLRRPGAFRERAVEGDAERRVVEVTDGPGAPRSIPTLRVEGSWCVELVVPEAEPG